MSFPNIVEVHTQLKADSSLRGNFVLMCWVNRLIRVTLALLLATGLSSCERAGTALAEPQYRDALVGDWHGNVGEDSESMSFEADGRFSCELRSNGFIGSTLGQGTTGTVRGSWTLQGNVIALALDHASGEQPVNLATTSTIVSFMQNQLVVKSDSGETSTFIRAM